jgi:hypothetical protein
MTGSNDPRERMTRFPSPAEADRLLRGGVALDDLPDEAAPIARLLAELETFSTADAFTERRIVGEMAAAIVDPPTSRVAVSGRRLSAKAGALAFVAVLATGTAAAAATGSLPPRIQRAISKALSHVAINVPNPDSHHTPTVESHDGGPDGRRSNGVAPGNATGPVAPRGVKDGKHGDTTPRGATRIGATGPAGPTGPQGNGRHVGQPTGATPTTNPNKGAGNNSGLHTGDTQGNHNGVDTGQHNGDANGKKNGADNGQGTKKTTTSTTPVKSNGNAGGNGNANGKTGGNAGGTGNGNANSSASQKVSGSP